MRHPIIISKYHSKRILNCLLPIYGPIQQLHNSPKGLMANRIFLIGEMEFYGDCQKTNNTRPQMMMISL